MKMVELLGTSHRFQYGAPDCSEEEEAAFISLLKELASRSKVAALAEEACEELMVRQPRLESTCATAARELKIADLYCEPSQSVRGKLGVRGHQAIEQDAWLLHWPQEQKLAEHAKEFAVRENYWSVQLLMADTWPVLFVCGAEHIRSFSTMLKSHGVVSKVVCNDWTPNE